MHVRAAAQGCVGALFVGVNKRLSLWRMRFIPIRAPWRRLLEVSAGLGLRLRLGLGGLGLGLGLRLGLVLRLLEVRVPVGPGRLANVHEVPTAKECIYSCIPVTGAEPWLTHCAGYGI